MNKNKILKLTLYPHFSFFVLVRIDNFATWLIDAKASPRNPYVAIFDKSENSFSLDVVKRSQTTFRSSFRIPEPLSLLINQFDMQNSSEKLYDFIISYIRKIEIPQW